MYDLKNIKEAHMSEQKFLNLNDIDKIVLKNYLEMSKSVYIGKRNAEIIPITEIKVVDGNPNKHTEEHLNVLCAILNKTV